MILINVRALRSISRGHSLPSKARTAAAWLFAAAVIVYGLHVALLLS